MENMENKIIDQVQDFTGDASTQENVMSCDAEKPSRLRRFGRWVKTHIKDIIEVGAGIAVGVFAKEVISSRKCAEDPVDTEMDDTMSDQIIDVETHEA
jgi:hypothetical protein